MTGQRAGVRAIDLFCGAGGLSLGLKRAGAQIVGAVDGWDTATRTYALNFEHPVVTTDLLGMPAAGLLDQLRIDGEVELVAGGPPCQGFSVQRIGSDTDGRNALVLEYGRLIDEIRPRLFLMENVPGLLGKRGRQTADAFISQLSSFYEVRVARVNAADYGVPQLRRRVFMYGWRRGTPPVLFPPALLTPEEYVTVREAIFDLPSPPLDFEPLPGDPLHRRTRLSALNVMRLRHIPPGGGMEDLPARLRADCHKHGPKKIGHRKVYGRLDPDAPGATITARFDSFTRGRFAHPFEDRNITLREGARLQTFPDDFRFDGTQEEVAALIGNAVPPLLAEAVGRSFVQSASTGSRVVAEQAGEVCSAGELQPALLV